MSTTPVVTATTTTTPSKVQTILEIIQLALTGLSAVPAVGAAAGLAGVFISIFQKATAAYQAETGQPFSVLNIPLETPVP